MKDQTTAKNSNQELQSAQFEYDNTGLPRDFDIRIEVAEQREVLEQTA